MLKSFCSYYKPHLRLLALDLGASFLVALCDLFYPMVTRSIINDYVPDRNLRLILIWSAAVLLIYAAKCGLNYFVQYKGHVLGVHIQGDMRRDMFRKLQKLPFSFYDENKTGKIMSRLINDLFDVSELAHHGPESLFISTVSLIGAFVMLSSINLYLALILFALIPPVVLFAVKTRSMMQEAFRRSREEIAEVNANVETAISGIRVSRAYTAEDSEIAKFDDANERFKKVRGMSYKAMGIFHSGMTFMTDFMYLAVLVSGGLFFCFGKINSGDFTAFILYTVMFIKPINNLVMIFEQIQNGMTGYARFEEIMRVSCEQESAGAEDAGTLKGDIKFTGVTFSYGDPDDPASKPVISNLDLSIPAGKTVALVGPSGGGKTTLCHLIPRFYDTISGSITIDGTDIRDMTRTSLRRNIGMVAQDVFLFNGTIKENIAYGNPDATDDMIYDAAKKANIHDYVCSLEKGYDTEVGERGIKLSGGQKQRISIARVFLKNPPILILDEATSALDNATEMLIQQSLEKLSEGRTSLIVAHRLSTIKHADEIIVLTRDGVAERGTHSQLIEKDGIYAGLYRYQFRE